MVVCISSIAQSEFDVLTFSSWGDEFDVLVFSYWGDELDVLVFSYWGDELDVLVLSYWGDLLIVCNAYTVQSNFTVACIFMYHSNWRGCCLYSLCIVQNDLVAGLSFYVQFNWHDGGSGCLYCLHYCSDLVLVCIRSCMLILIDLVVACMCHSRRLCTTVWHGIYDLKCFLERECRMIWISECTWFL